MQVTTVRRCALYIRRVECREPAVLPILSAAFLAAFLGGKFCACAATRVSTCLRQSTAFKALDEQCRHFLEQGPFPPPSTTTTLNALSPRPPVPSLRVTTVFLPRHKAQQAVLAEADGVLAAIPPGITGPELSFLKSYKEVADLLSARGQAKARLAGALAVNMLAPPDGYHHEGATDGHAALSAAPTPPPRTWAHLLRLSVPALEATAAAAMAVSMEEEGEEAITVTEARVHALLAKLQALVASENRVGSVCGVGRRSSSRSTLASAPAPYGFGGGGGAGQEEEVSRIRRALAACLGATMMFQNAQEAAPPGRRQELASGRRSEMLLGNKRLPAEALIAPRVAV